MQKTDRPMPAFENLSWKNQSRLIGGLQEGATRRDLLRWLGAMGITAAAGQAIIGSASAALAQNPKRGGVLRVAWHATGGSAETLDPVRQQFSIDYVRARCFFNALTRISGKGEAMPELAESFESSPDGKEWIFRIRKGAEFHDGKTLTAQDVVYSLLRHKDPKNASVAKVLVDGIESIIADGPNVVRIKSSSPDADLPLVLGTTQFAIVKDSASDFFRPVGTGPFKLDHAFVPEAKTTGKRFGNYFLEGRPYLDEVQIFSVSDAVARANALFAGDVDAALYLNASALEEVAANPDLQVLVSKSGAFDQFTMLLDQKPTNDRDLRLAIKNLLDRERYVNTVHRGHAQIGNDHPIPPNHPFYNHDLPQRAVDFDRADFHLKKAGLKGSTIQLSVTDAVKGSVEMGQILKQTAAKAGLTIDLKKEPADGYYANVWMKKPFSGNSWQTRPTINLLLTVGWLSSAKWNDTALRDTSFDKLVTTARQEVDQDKRKQLYGEIQKFIWEEGGNATYAFPDIRDALSSKVKGIEPNPIAPLGGFYFNDTAWLDT